MKFFDENLISLTSSLYADHLGLAVEAFYRCQTTDERSKNAISVILHGYCGLESAVNFLGYEMFVNTDSDKFIEESKRDIPLKRFLEKWNISLPCLEKIDFLLSLHNDSLNEKLRNELIELNNLRNWISHGMSFKVTWLIEPNKHDKTSGTVLDQEYSINWSEKFPNTKFNSPDRLDKNDAEKSLRIVLETLKHIAIATNQPFHLITYINEPNYKIIFKDTVIEEILNINNPKP